MEMLNHYWEVRMTCQAGVDEPDWGDPLLQSSIASSDPGLLDVLRDWHRQTDIVELRLTHDVGDDYDWVMEHRDGRRWIQRIRMGESLGLTAMTFDVPDFWEIREIAGQRSSIIKLLVGLLVEYPLVELKVEWS